MGTTLHRLTDYQKVKSELTRKDDRFFDDYVVATAALIKSGGDRFSIAEQAVLFFIIGRTLLFRKRAETILTRHFVEGVNGGNGARICSGSGVKERATRDVIRALSDKNIIECHGFVEGNAEVTPRIYSINLDVLVLECDVEEVKLMAVSRKTPPGRICHTPWQNLPTLTSTNVDITSTNVEVSEPSAPSEESSLLPRRKRVTRAAAIDCKSTTPQELLAAISERYKSNRADRISKATKITPKKWTTLQAQALLDQARQAAQNEGHDVPRIIVVAKCLGVLHKRLLAAEVDNVQDFFKFAYTNWSTFSSANRRAKARQFRETGKEASEMRAAPNFQDLAYRCPYILAFYAEGRFQTKAEAKALAEQQQREAKDNERVQQSIEQRKRVVREQDLERERTRRTRPAPSRRPVVADDDEEIPVFKEKQWSPRK